MDHRIESLMTKIREFAEARHRQGHSTYNIHAAATEAVVVTALDAAFTAHDARVKQLESIAVERLRSAGGEYPELPKQVGVAGYCPTYTSDQMRAYVDADRAARAQAQAQAPAAVEPVASERQAFETDWMSRHHPIPMNTRLRDDGRYGDHIIQGQWETWQARAAHATTKAEPAPALSEQDAGLLEQGASMLEGLENDFRNMGHCSGAEGAACSAHAVRRLAVSLLRASPVDALDALSPAARDVITERQRQIKAEGWTPDHDDAHGDGDLAIAASCYACAGANLDDATRDWPWADEWWKPGTPRRNLIKSGALILAEIERIDRSAMAAQQENN